MARNGLEGASAEVAALNRKLKAFAQTEGLKENSRWCWPLTAGHCLLGQRPSYIGISIAERGYFKDA